MAEVGSAGEEAARLFTAAEQWARDRAGALRDGALQDAGLFDGGGPFGPEHLATGSASCQVCPVCQAVTALRQVTPETVEHLLDAAASVVAALRSTLGASPDAPPRPGVQRIRVQADDVPADGFQADGFQTDGVQTGDPQAGGSRTTHAQQHPC